MTDLPRIESDTDFQLQQSFPAIHKVGNVFVQLLIKIDWKHFRIESVSTQIYICHSALDKNWSDWILYLTDFPI